MNKVRTINYDGNVETIEVSDEVYEVFEDSRKLDQRLAKSDQRHIDKYSDDVNGIDPSKIKSNFNMSNPTQIDAENKVIRQQTNEFLSRNIKNRLNDEEREVLKMKFDDGLKNVEIAKRLGITKQAVGEKIGSILRKIRRS